MPLIRLQMLVQPCTNGAAGKHQMQQPKLERVIEVRHTRVVIPSLDPHVITHPTNGWMCVCVLSSLPRSVHTCAQLPYHDHDDHHGMDPAVLVDRSPLPQHLRSRP